MSIKRSKKSIKRSKKSIYIKKLNLIEKVDLFDLLSISFDLNANKNL